jgi:hypothetical protein
MVILGLAPLAVDHRRTEETPPVSVTTFHKFNSKRELDNHPNFVAKKLRKNLKFVLTFNDYLFILILT